MIRTVTKIFYLLAGISVALATLNVLEIGAAARWSGWILASPLFLGIFIIVVDFVFKMIIAYATLITMVQVLYDDYDQRTAQQEPLHLFENHEGESHGS